MKLRIIEVHNFGSYKDLEFDYTSLGLTLISGPTGSGKSTLQDAAFWVLYGKTAKGGNVDDIRSWQSKEPTVGVVVLDHNSTILTITRIRGTSQQNDLYWSEKNKIYRGKDITETQQLLEQRLGVSSEMYAAATYYNEFSPTGSFFIDNARDRRELFEMIAPLEFSTALREKLAHACKETKHELAIKIAEEAKLSGKSEQLRISVASADYEYRAWGVGRAATIASLYGKSTSFETEKAKKIAKITAQEAQYKEMTRKNSENLKQKMAQNIKDFVAEKTCQSCGVIQKKDEMGLIELEETYRQILSSEEKSYNPHSIELENIRQSTDPYIEQLEIEKNKQNPFSNLLERTKSDYDKSIDQCTAIAKVKADLEKRKDALLHLIDLVSDLRAILLKRTVKEIETQTNTYLEKYFESEIRVIFDTNGSDSLDLEIVKGGYTATYKQLSKGQRGLLKLCFSLSVMKAASNKIGIHFDTIMLDEGLDGLDADLKIKAFNLLSELENTYENILVIDHAEELKSLFSRRFNVSLESDHSVITEVL